MKGVELNSLIQSAATSNVGELFHNIAVSQPQRIALRDNERSVTYRELDERSNRLANYLLSQGIVAGDRIAVLSNNRLEYFELLLAAAKAGVILAVLNWRLHQLELEHCVTLVGPKLIVATSECAEQLASQSLNSINTLILGEEYESRLQESATAVPCIDVDQEEGLVILYTSGTTGLPKGALISHRAMMARSLIYHLTLHVPDQDNFIAWTPFYHMVSTDHGLATLLRGGTVWCVDGYQPDRLIWLIENLQISWLVLVPGMVSGFNEALKKSAVKPKGIGVIGAMPDLIPAEDICQATQLLNAPFLNTFGATETGLPPATGGRIPIGAIPGSLSKTQTPFCNLRLEDANGNEVSIGEPGEVVVSGPSLFSGYWNNEKTNLEDFREGRFHMGDVMRRNDDGTLDYVDRVKYIIKSGGENIYPAEIEKILVADDRIDTVIVVRKTDPKWGEVPVAFIVKCDQSMDEQEVSLLCQSSMASFKRPKEIRFIEQEDIPRSTTGKIQRHLLEELL